MSKIKKLLRNRNFILLLAAMFGLLLPQGSRWTANLTLPALAVIMSLSTMGVSGNVFRSPRSLIVPAILGILMSYVVLAGFILGISAIIIHEENIWKGIIILWHSLSHRGLSSQGLRQGPFIYINQVWNKAGLSLSLARTIISAGPKTVIFPNLCVRLKL